MYSIALSLSPFVLACKAKAFKREIGSSEVDDDVGATEEQFAY